MTIDGMFIPAVMRLDGFLPRSIAFVLDSYTAPAPKLDRRQG
ncbi:hypothetical protein [Sinorhizobium meliloti]|nr:hypothetical protein [Sinorhizobium meliloti]